MTCLKTVVLRILMTFKYRQKTGVVDITCVAMLCTLTTMLLGFSTPQHAFGVDESAPQVKPELPEDLAMEPIDLKTPVMGLLVTSLAPPTSDSMDSQRPFSLADDTYFDQVLNEVGIRTWQMPSLYSPDRIISNQVAPVVGKFHGVGFPDIRTYSRAKPSPYAEPGPWAPLISWRTPKGGDAIPQPIARVRCMGLSPQAVAQRADRYRELIYDYAQTYAVSPHLVKAVITAESCFNNKALSPVGAQGLMQLMPDTASWLKVKDPHDPAQNLRGGVKYLASLQKEFDTTELALAAYNAGPGNVRRYDGVPPFAETLAYVVKVQSHYRRYKAAHRLRNPADESFEQASSVNLLTSE